MTQSKTVRNMHQMRWITIFRITIIVLIFGYLVGCSPANSYSAKLNDFIYEHTQPTTNNLWEIIGHECQLPYETPDIPEVREKINWYMSHPMFLIKAAQQARPYLYYIYQQVKKRHLPAEIALIPIIETAYDPFQYSGPGAGGLWQIMPGTASGFGLTIDWWYDGRRDIVAATNAALNYFDYLQHFFNGNWILAIAAYDGGEGAVERAVEKNAKQGKSTDFWSLPLAKETQDYIPKLLALATILKNPYQYPIDLPPVPNTPYLIKVNVGSQIDLKRAATMANMSLEDLLAINPGFNRWATDPKGPHILLFPVDKADQFKTNLAKLPKAKRVTWTRYRVKPGDSLNKIAKKYKTKVTLLLEVNQLKNKIIHVGQILLIPTSTHQLAKVILQSQQRYFTSTHKVPEIPITNHVVKYGETLTQIAKKYGVSPREILFWNGLKSNKTESLPLGKKLIIWPHRKPTFKIKKVIYYKVRSGDTLISIANTYQLDAHQLKVQNGLRSTLLHPGQTLSLYPENKASTSTYRNPTKHTKSHSKPTKNQTKSKMRSKNTAQAKHKRITTTANTHKAKTRAKTPKPQSQPHQPKKIIYHVKSGDTLYEIAKKYNITAQQIKQWNQITGSYLKPKQILVIYKS